MADPELRERAAADFAATLLSLETVLHPSWVGDHSTVSAVRQRLAAGRLVVIRDAFHATFAERMFQCLNACTAWRVYEKYEPDFHYHHHNLYKRKHFPTDLQWCDSIFASPTTKAFASLLSGRDCRGPTAFSASWYLPGDHSLPHSDAVANAADANRQLAFVWHLTKNWRPEWGGALFWCPRSVYVPPRFNTLVLFNVGPDTAHFVTQVSPYAQGKRLTINGWWTGPESTGEHRDPVPEQLDVGPVSIEVY